MFSNNNKYNNTSGPAKTSLNKGQGVVKANPCWSRCRGRSIKSFAHNFFLSQLLPMIFKISRNTRIQDPQRLTLFRSRPLFSCKGIAINITKIIPCLSQPSPSICSLETCNSYVQLEPMDQDRPERYSLPQKLLCVLFSLLLHLFLSLRTKAAQLSESVHLCRCLCVKWLLTGRG